MIFSIFNIDIIKTIGDSYMAAAGVPVPSPTHARDIIRAAIQMQQFVNRFNENRRSSNKTIFEIRIGIHTGSVIAGIVGSKKFAYDIWGDAVNTASRMESSGESGKINISSATYSLVKDEFNFIHRGKITAKNKGEFDMYFLDPAQPFAGSPFKPC
jgi:class 3 adenylate cyclase